MIYKRSESLDNTSSILPEMIAAVKPPVPEVVPEVVPQVVPQVNSQIMPEVITQNEVVGNSDNSYEPNLPSANKPRTESENQFINEYMNYSRFGNKIDHITTDDEINAYRKSFLDFRNVTNTSSHGFDPVDQMNLANISGLYKDGLKVKDVYDKISAKNFDTTKIDVTSMQFNDRVDNYIHSNTFEYDNDEVSNGGFFFNKIKGTENRDLDFQAFP